MTYDETYDSVTLHGATMCYTLISHDTLLLSVGLSPDIPSFAAPQGPFHPAPWELLHLGPSRNWSKGKSIGNFRKPWFLPPDIGATFYNQFWG